MGYKFLHFNKNISCKRINKLYKIKNYCQNKNFLSNYYLIISIVSELSQITFSWYHTMYACIKSLRNKIF